MSEKQNRFLVFLMNMESEPGPATTETTPKGGSQQVGLFYFKISTVVEGGR